MTGITRQHVNDMAKIMSALNGGSASPSSVTPVSSATASPDGEAMGKIMAAFNAATEDMVSTAETYPELKRALVTEAIDDGVRVGSWNIVVETVEGLGKFYNVNHSITNDPIASELRLYEAALALVNSLNEGHTITSLRVKTILSMEEEYARALADAVHFSSRAKLVEGMQRDVAEARYSEAKHRALTAKKTLNGIIASY